MKSAVNKSIDSFLKKKGIKSNSKTNYKVSIITPTNEFHSLPNILENFQRQDLKEKELIIIINNNEIDEYKWKNSVSKYENIQVFKLDENISLGECLNFGIEKAKYDIIARFDADDYYGPKYLLDSIKAFEYSDALLIGKATIFVYFVQNKILAIKDSGLENQYVYFVNGSTMIFKKELFEKVKFRNISCSEDLYFCKDCIENNIKIYSLNKYHIVYIRQSNLDKHTWKLKNEDLFRLYCHPIGKVDDFIPYIDI
ncbi:MAG: glycosyltransferase family 2 protein [Tissierellia bacterium]|nr:glycosyltransferase family 2 protein [Tissierellia bacterium]